MTYFIPVWSPSLSPCLQASNEITILFLVDEIQSHLETNCFHVSFTQC